MLTQTNKEKIKKINQSLLSKYHNLSPRLHQEEDIEDERQAREILNTLKSQHQTIFLPKIQTDNKQASTKLNMSTMVSERKQTIDSLPLDTDLSTITVTHYPQKSLKSSFRNASNVTATQRKYRLSSNLNEVDADMLCQKLIMNKIHHKEFDPRLYDRNQIQQIRNVLIKENGESGIFAKKKFKNSEPSLVEQIIEESLLSRNDLNELNSKRSKSQNKSTANSILHSKPQVVNPFSAELAIKKLVEDIEQNESVGFVPSRSISRQRRVRNVVYEQFERQFVKASNSTVVNTPPYVSYFEFKKNENIKNITKEILKGTFNFDEEEGKLNKLLYSLLSRSEKHAFTLQTRKDKKLNKARFMSTGRSGMNATMNFTDGHSTQDQMNWITNTNSSLYKNRNQSKDHFDLMEVFEKGDSQFLLSENWTGKTAKDFRKEAQQSTLSPSKKIRFIKTTVDGETENSDEEESKDKVDSGSVKIDRKYVKDTVREIINKSNQKIEVDTRTFDNIMKLEKQKAKVGRGIGKFLDLQDEKKAGLGDNKTILDFIYDQEVAKKQNLDNFKSKDIVDKVKEENFQNSVYINYLGKVKIWKPDRFYILSGRKNKLFNLTKYYKTHYKSSARQSLLARNKSSETIKSTTSTQSHSTVNQSKTRNPYNKRLSSNVMQLCREGPILEIGDNLVPKTRISLTQRTKKIKMKISQQNNPEVVAEKKSMKAFEYKQQESSIKRFQMFTCYSNQRKDIEQLSNHHIIEMDSETNILNIQKKNENNEYNLNMESYTHPTEANIQNLNKSYQSGSTEGKQEGGCEINMDLKMFSDNSLTDLSFNHSNSRIFHDQHKLTTNTILQLNHFQLYESNLENLDSTVIEEISKINEIQIKSRNNNIEKYTSPIHHFPHLQATSQPPSQRQSDDIIIHFQTVKNRPTRHSDYVLFKYRKFGYPLQVRKHALGESDDDDLFLESFSD